MKHCHDIIINMKQQQHQMQLIFNHRINFQAYIPLASLLSRLCASSSFSSLPLLIWFSVYPIYQYTRTANAHTRGHHRHATPQYELRCGVCVYERDLVLHSISIYGKKFRQTFAFHGSQQTEHCSHTRSTSLHTLTYKYIYARTFNIACHPIHHSNSKRPIRLSLSTKREILSVNNEKTTTIFKTKAYYHQI